MKSISGLSQDFCSHLSNVSNRLNSNELNQLISDELISPFVLNLSKEIVDQLYDELKKYNQLRAWSEQNIINQYEQMGLKIPRNSAICMSYDFHLNSQGNLELIEVNTNAGFNWFGMELYEFMGLENPIQGKKTKDLINTFIEEMKSMNLDPKSSLNVAIVDEVPSEQKLYSEFLFTKALFQDLGWRTEILDITNDREIEQADFVYNRYQDFYFEWPQSQQIKKIFNAKLNFSSQPFEYEGLLLTLETTGSG